MPKYADGSSLSKETEDAAAIKLDGCQTRVHAHIDEARQIVTGRHYTTYITRKHEIAEGLSKTLEAEQIGQIEVRM